MKLFTTSFSHNEFKCSIYTAFKFVHMCSPRKVIILSFVSFPCANRDQNGGEFNNFVEISNNLPLMSWTLGQLVRFLIKSE